MRKAYIAVTDNDWFDTVSKEQRSEVNFWSPGARKPANVEVNSLFLFKLRGSDHRIAGGGFFQHTTTLPIWLAWESFGMGNGMHSQKELREKISEIRGRRSGHDTPNQSPGLICRILSNVFFLPQDQRIQIPGWANSIVSGKNYNLDEEPGASMLQELQAILREQTAVVAERQVAEDTIGPYRYGDLKAYRPRLGQGAFRTIVTDAYQRRCALTGEKVLPVLEAAHVRPYAQDGEHSINNGVLMKSDLHILFDRGYIAINPDDKRIVVSKNIHEEFDNGRDYYALHGREIRNPENSNQALSASNLGWHYEHIYRG